MSYAGNRYCRLSGQLCINWLVKYTILSNWFYNNMSGLNCWIGSGSNQIVTKLFNSMRNFEYSHNSIIYQCNWCIWSASPNCPPMPVSYYHFYSFRQQNMEHSVLACIVYTEIVVQFLQRFSIACYAKRCTSYRKSVRPSVCLSVHHTLAMCQNDSSYNREISTVG